MKKEKLIGFEKWLKKNNVDCFNKNLLLSNSWTLGGHSGNMYDSSVCDIYPDDQPTDFENFDLFILKAYPTLSLSEYKQLWRHSVTIEIHSYDDYYNSHTNEAYYQCDLKKLYEKLKELKII